MKPLPSFPSSQNVPSPKSRKEKEIEATDKLLAKAEDLLKEVDESYVMNEGRPRAYPTFDRSEVKFGPILGVGGFGIVFEVKGFYLKPPTDVSTPKAMAALAIDVDIVAPESKLNPTHIMPSLPENNTTSNEIAMLPATDNNSRTKSRGSVRISETMADPPSEEKHYDVRHARTQMSKHARRSGDARYAIKRLHRDLSDLERARGMIDLAIEAKFLSVIWHPNIVKMRGMSTGPMLDSGFFIIMDRLYETLMQKMHVWGDRKSKNRGKLFGIGANKSELDQLMVERMTVAYDLAAAFWYMHEHKLVYRDIKQENIGFDIRGDVKVFDFGLCKSLSPALKAKDTGGREVYGYLLTPRTGSVPYMAPEVADCRAYDCQCDVFSFAILLWEVLALKAAYKGYSRREFLERVVRKQERPQLNRNWPPLTRLMIREAWDHDPEKRPDMKRVAVMIRGDLNEMSADASVRDRTAHMRERSAHSFRLSRTLPRSHRSQSNLHDEVAEKL